MTPQFRLFLWPQRLLLIGPGVDTGCHRHHAAQLCIGLDSELRLRSPVDGDWQCARGLFIAADQPHQLDAGGQTTAFLYLDGESSECRRLASLHAPQRIAVVEAGAATPLLWQLAQGGDPALAPSAVAALIGNDDAATAVPDRRLQAALDWIGSHLAGPVRIAELAAAVHLSESHLAHLFPRQVGLTLRRYVLWRRLRMALECAMRGDSLTAAAHAAGFADSAHLSRSFRDHFGVAPSFLFEQRAAIAQHHFE